MTLVDDRYELLEVIGSGGMATVWKARDTTLSRLVAFKRPHPAGPDSDVHERFGREARHAATVSHPNIVTVFDVGLDDDGPYLTMELVDGPSLADTNPADVDARSIGFDLASGLAALHEAGIVHRDIKPANVMLAEGGPKLTDFGIARSLTDTAELTKAGATFATPAYAAPEVVAAGVHSAASDVYSLGVVLAELVTGRRVTPNTDTSVLITDGAWRDVIEAAIDPDPSLRPAASELVASIARLRPADATTTAVMHRGTAVGQAVTDPIDRVVGGSLDDRVVSDPQPVARRRREPLERNRRRLALLLGGAAMACLGLLAIGILGSDDDPVGTAALAPTAPPTDADVQSAVDVASHSADDAPEVTVAPEVAAALDDIARLRGDFESFIDDLRGRSISDREADRLLDDVAKGIEALGNDDSKRMSREFEDAFDRIEAQIDDPDAGVGATRRLLALVTGLGVEVTNG